MKRLKTEPTIACIVLYCLQRLIYPRPLCHRTPLGTNAFSSSRSDTHQLQRLTQTARRRRTARVCRRWLRSHISSGSAASKVQHRETYSGQKRNNRWNLQTALKFTPFISCIYVGTPSLQRVTNCDAFCFVKEEHCHLIIYKYSPVHWRIWQTTPCLCRSLRCTVPQNAPSLPGQSPPYKNIVQNPVRVCGGAVSFPRQGGQGEDETERRQKCDRIQGQSDQQR